ncbi:quinone oxidoreductase family protein [Nocardioides sp. YJ-D4]
MRAAVQVEYGGPDVLRLDEVADPEPRPGWSVIQLKAAALNWHDVLVRRGQYGSPLPHVPGADGAGIDRATGDEVVVLPSLWWGEDESAPGARWEILGDRRHGTYAELVAVPTECVWRKPRRFSWAEAAALPLVGVTTFRALFTRGRLRAGESVLVLGAGGGVATMAVSLAAAAGARVFVTSSSEEKIERSRALGAEGGVLYTDPEWPAAARAAAGGGFDLVIDSVGTWTQSLEAARAGGRVVVLGASRAERAAIDVRPFYFAQVDLLGTTMGSPHDFAGLLERIDEHDIPAPIIDKTFGLAEVSDAHRHLEAGHGFGKIVLEIG